MVIGCPWQYDASGNKQCVSTIDVDQLIVAKVVDIAVNNMGSPAAVARLVARDDSTSEPIRTTITAIVQTPGADPSPTTSLSSLTSTSSTPTSASGPPTSSFTSQITSTSSIISSSSAAVTSTVATTSPTPTSSTLPTASSNGLSVGAKVGITVASVVAIIGIVIVLACLHINRRGRKQKQYASISKASLESRSEAGVWQPRSLHESYPALPRELPREPQRQIPHHDPHPGQLQTEYQSPHHSPRESPREAHEALHMAEYQNALPPDFLGPFETREAPRRAELDPNSGPHEMDVGEQYEMDASEKDMGYERRNDNYDRNERLAVRHGGHISPISTERSFLDLSDSGD